MMSVNAAILQISKPEGDSDKEARLSNSRGKTTLGKTRLNRGTGYPLVKANENGMMLIEVLYTSIR